MERAIRIYDFLDTPTDVVIPDKKIKAINVMVISGDEVVDILFEDGAIIHADSSTTRTAAHYDAHYIVQGEQIERWINFVSPRKWSGFAYDRYNAFLFVEYGIGDGDEEGPESPSTTTITEDMYCGQPFLSQAGKWICIEPNRYIFFDKTTDKVWRITEVTDEVVFEEGDKSD